MIKNQSPHKGRSLSVLVQRSRLTGQHRAYVRIGFVDAGYRDLCTGQVVCTEDRHSATVTAATAALFTPPVMLAPAG